MHSYFYHAKAYRGWNGGDSVSLSGVIQTTHKIFTMNDYCNAKQLVSQQDDAKQNLFNVVITTLTYLGEFDA